MNDLDQLPIRVKHSPACFLATIPDILDRLINVSDFFLVIKTLNENSVLCGQQYLNVINVCASQCNSQQGKLNILKHLLKCVNIKTIEITVRGCFGRISANVALIDVPNADFILQFYHSVKSNIDNAIFKTGVRLELKVRLHNLKVDLSQTDGIDESVDERQRIADKMVPLYVNLLLQYRNQDERKAILNEMKASFPTDIDTVAMEIVYHSKMAVTAEMGDNLELAETEMRSARYLSSQIRPCLATYLLNHDEQYIYRREYEQHKQQHHLTRVVQVGQNAMQTLVDTPTEIQNQWNRFHIIFIVMSWLSINHDFKFWNENALEIVNIECAKTMLVKAKTYSQDIEIRREMIYTLCWSRIYEQTDKVLTYAYLKNALDLANEGGAYCEIENTNIKEHVLRVESELKHNGGLLVNA